MAKTFVRPDTQIRSVDTYNDTVTPSEADFETNPVNLNDDINNIISQLSSLRDVQAGDWFTGPNTPSTLETGTQRGVNDLNTALHAVEKKRVLREVHSLTDVTVGGSDNFVILGTGELPAQTTASVGITDTLGTIVAAHGGTFGTHALSEVAGTSAVNPDNLMEIVDGSTRDPILSSGAKIYGLLQGESGVTDGATITDTTATRVQISFVIVNGTGDDLIACPAVDIQGKTINYCTREQVRWEDLNRADMLRGAIVDVGAGAGTIDRQTAYTNQGATAVDVVTNSRLDLEAAGINWEIRDDLEAMVFEIVEGSAGGTTQVNLGAAVDEFDVDAVVNDFLNGASFDTGAAGTTINVGTTANQIDSGGALTLQSAAASILRMDAGGSLEFGDTNEAGSTWATPLVLSDSSAEWDLAETNFGEVSLLNMLNQAFSSANFDKTCAVVNSTTVADTDVGGTGGGANLDAQIHDISGGTFADDHDVFLNGILLRGGADASANHDYYPGTSLALGQLKFEFTVKVNDQICVVSRA